MKYILLATTLLILSLNSFATSPKGEKDVRLQDLALVGNQKEVSPETYEKRFNMLQTNHRYLAYGAAAFMTAAMISGKHGDVTSTHKWTGYMGGLLYYTTAAYAYFAPKPADVQDYSGLKWHRRLSYVHFPMMVMAPILGALAKKDLEDGKEPSGLHAATAKIGYWTFMASLALISFDVDWDAKVASWFK